jgi:trafficking protein particle complex subunit 9
MAVDLLSPIAPARLSVLLLPVGKIRRSRFLGFAERLQAENVIRLGDVSPDSRPNRSVYISGD